MRREEILNSAKKIFMKKGYGRATIDEIARESGVAKGTIYLYFKSKEDLFISLITEQMRNIARIAEEVNQSDPIKRLIEFGKKIALLDPPIHQILSYGQIPLSPTFVKRVRKEMIKNFGRVVEIIAGWITEGIEQKKFVRVDPVNAASLFIALTRFIPTAKFFSNIEVDMTEVLNIFLDGIRRR